MPTLFLTPRYSEDSQVLWRAATRLGWGVERLVKWQLPNGLNPYIEPVLYLEDIMADAIAEQLGVSLLNPTNDWLCELPQEYRKRWVYLSSLKEARKLKEKAFIKPPNNKSFPARVYAAEDLPTDYPDETPVLVAEIVQWEKEFRCFILNRSVKTFSIYLRDGNLQKEDGFTHNSQEESEVRDFVETMLCDRRVELPLATVIDVGVIKDRGWAAIEQNGAWGAGLYGCDPDLVLEVLRYAVVSA
jgi:hypothetical protein